MIFMTDQVPIIADIRDTFSKLNRIEQFDWARNWKRVKPFLNDPEVQEMLTFGLRARNRRYKPGDPPWRVGTSKRKKAPRKDTLQWYQPRLCCYYIAPFSWAIGKKLYPELHWGFWASDAHAVAVGFDQAHLKIVMDILLYNTRSAASSIRYVEEGDRPVCVWDPTYLFFACGRWVGGARGYTYSQAFKESVERGEQRQPEYTLSMNGVFDGCQRPKNMASHESELATEAVTMGNNQNVATAMAAK